MADDFYPDKVAQEILSLKELCDRERLLIETLKNQEAHHILFNINTLKVTLLPKRSLVSNLKRYFKERVFKDSIEGKSAVAFNVHRFRKGALDLVYSMQETLSKNQDTPSVVAIMQQAFSDVEAMTKEMAEMIASSSIEEKDSLAKTLKEMDYLIGKEKGRNLDPLIFFAELKGSWEDSFEDKIQDINILEFQDKSLVLQKGGRTLAMMVKGRKKAGRWGFAFDIEGKSTFFQETAEKIFQGELKEKKRRGPSPLLKRLEEEFKLFSAYLHGLKSPEESREGLESLRRAFTHRLGELSGDEGLRKLTLLIENEKEEAEVRFRLLKKRWSEKREKAEAIKRRLDKIQESVGEAPEFPVDSIDAPFWPQGTLPDQRTKLIKLLKTLLGLKSLESYRNEWNKARSIRKELVGQGLIDPSFEEVRDPVALFGETALLTHCMDIEEAIASEIAKRQKDLLDISQMMESYQDRLENRVEMERLKSSLQEYKKLKERSFVRDLLEKSDKRRSIFQVAKPDEELNEAKECASLENLKKGSLALFEESKTRVEALAKTLGIEKSPLFITEEDLLEAFSLIAEPYMTEGTQGKLPKELAFLKEEVDRNLGALEEMRQSPLLGLSREMERIRTLIKNLAAILVPLRTIHDFLQHHRNERLKELEMVRLIKDKKRIEEEVSRILEDVIAAEKELLVLEGILAVEIELGIFLSA